MAELSPARWQVVSPYLDHALELGPEECASWLGLLRLEDSELAADIETLLEERSVLSREGFLEGAAPQPPAPASLAGQTMGAYTLISLIGQGGMGNVWLARRSDGRFEGQAAVKLLNASLAGRAGEGRFRREGSILARLNHPHIARLADAGVSPTGQPYLVLEYVEGEPIDRYCDRKGLGVEGRLRLFLNVLDAVAHAHANMIVHRDIKPSNVLVGPEGRVKLLDFGIAKLLAGDTNGGDTSALTREGGRAMTPEYAAPEQITGGEVTTATDVYALGVLLYELLVGALPIDAKRLREADWAEMDRIIREEEPVRPSTRISSLGAMATSVADRRKTDPVTLRRELKGDLDWITLKALEKDPARRYSTAAEFTADIERHLKDEPVRAGRPNAPYRLKKLIRRRRGAFASALVFVLAITGAFLFERLRLSASGHEDIKRVAVLPFENLGAAEDDYFADGIADEVRSKLTNLRGVEVIARASSIPYKKTRKTPKEIARELDVKYLLTATVRWQKGSGASRVHVTPELVEVRDSGAPSSKWEQPFDASLTDVFQVQSDIATRVAQALDIALAAGEAKRLAATPTQNLDAYDAYLKGEEASQAMGANDPPSLHKALALYEQAVELDPSFAPAWARVSITNSVLYVNGTSTPELPQRARQAAEKAVALAPDRPEGYVALGNYELNVVRDFSLALEQYAKGQTVAPANADLLCELARAEESLGHWEAALEHLKQAERLDPRSVSTLRRLGYALLWMRRYREAREALDRGLALAPANLLVIEYKAMSYLGEGDLAGALAVPQAAPKDVERSALVAFVANYWDLGWILDEVQRDLLLRLTPRAFDDDRGTWGFCLAQAYALKGDQANARLYAEEGRKIFEEQLRATPDDAQLHMELGLSLAYLGRKEEASGEGLRGVGLVPVSKDAYWGPYFQHQLIRIYMIVGEPERALDRLEPLLKMPYYLSPGWLRIDPNFDSLRGNPRFQKLVTSGK